MMWVWSDELADRFPAIGIQLETAIPLVAYAVDRDTDLEDFAREVLASSPRVAGAPAPHPADAPVVKR